MNNLFPILEWPVIAFFNRFSVFTLSAIVVVSVFGCGGGIETPPMHQVSGRLTIDGKPAADFIVTMTVEGKRPCSGTTDSDGKFTMYYNKENPGVVAGENLVTVTMVNPDPDVNPDYEKYKDILDRYTEKTSTHKVTIDKDEENLDLSLK